MEKPDIKKRTLDFPVRIINLCKTLEHNPSVSRTLANQLLSSGTSIGAHVAESQAAQSKKDFISKISIASKEDRETSYWIELLIAASIVPEGKLKGLADALTQLAAILTSIIKTSQENLTSSSLDNSELNTQHFFP